MRAFAALLAIALLLGPLLGFRADAAEGPTATIDEIEKPLLFAYGSWEGRVRSENGQALIRGDGVNPRGGAGCNVQVDLTGHADDCPALKLKVGAANNGKTLRLLLIDRADHVGVWSFLLPEPSDAFQVILPQAGEPLSRPTSVEKIGPPDPAHLVQWQLGGDWADEKPLDVVVDAILVVKPDQKALALRVAKVRKDKEETERRQAAQTALRQKYGHRTELSPTVERLGLVAPQILAIEISSGHIEPGSLGPYQSEPGDERIEREKQVILKRKGQEIGWLIGPKRDQLVRFEQFQGDPLLLDDVTTAPANYLLRSTDDPTFASETRPTAVYGKSKPTDWAQPGRQFVMRHIVYLVMAKPLTPGKHYRYNLGELNVREPEGVFACDPAATRSEAVHASQIGYRADDPVKRAFLSTWLGTGGALTYPPGLGFTIRHEGTGAIAFTGKVEVVLPADGKETLQRDGNFEKTSVSRMDYSSLQEPGRYRVCVEGIGCSEPFEIGAKTWEHAFLTQMRGLFNERSGVELGPPYTAFKKPRDFHPADGAKVTQSTYSALQAGGEAFAALAKGDTGKPVPDAWGGYHDAGDWNPRRATHLRVTMAQLELMEMFPAYFQALKLNIPNEEALPDVLVEGLFEIDCFRRLQEPDGGVPHGIETAGDPIDGEVSWLQSMPAYVYAPDVSSSYVFAAAAARAARVIRQSGGTPSQVDKYEQSALKAMKWAEADRARRKAEGSWSKLSWEITDQRNLAAIVLYNLTGDSHWHDVFLEDSCLKAEPTNLFAWGHHVQRDAAFVYARLPDGRGDSRLKDRAARGLEQQARKALTYAGGNAFNLTTPDSGKPMFLGFYSTPDATELARAHFLTGKPEYLAGVVQATQFQSGCNPNNMTYTVGLGTNGPKHPLHLDSRRTGQPAPEGLTVYGNIDFERWNDDGNTWPIKWFLSKECVPSAWDWPISEAYYDIFTYPMINEFTVDMWAPNIFVWGYLAARK